jgi:hypothetical protein
LVGSNFLKAVSIAGLLKKLIFLAFAIAPDLNSEAVRTSISCVPLLAIPNLKASIPSTFIWFEEALDPNSLLKNDILIFL